MDVEDDVLRFRGVSVAAGVFAVLLAAGVAFVALPAVGSKAVFDEVRAGAVRAGECCRDCDCHYSSILT